MSYVPYGKTIIILREEEDETVETTGYGAMIDKEPDNLVHSVKTAFEALEKKKKENKRDWELLQLSKHITQLREDFNDPVSLKLLEATLETNAMLVREDYEQM